MRFLLLLLLLLMMMWRCERVESVLSLLLYSEVGCGVDLVLCPGFFPVELMLLVVGKLVVRFGLFLACLRLGVLVMK